MTSAQMPGLGDEITWGPVMHPNDPRQPEPGDDDGALDSLADQRDDYAMRALVDEVFNASGQSTDSLWLLGDHQGTPRDIVDDNGVLRKQTKFDSFGQVKSEQFYARSGSEIDATHAEAVE